MLCVSLLTFLDVFSLLHTRTHAHAHTVWTDTQSLKVSTYYTKYITITAYTQAQQEDIERLVQFGLVLTVETARD